MIRFRWSFLLYRRKRRRRRRVLRRQQGLLRGSFEPARVTPD